MTEENNTDDSIYVIPENHPLIVLSDEEKLPDEPIAEARTLKTGVRIKQELGEEMKKNRDTKVNRGKVKIEKSEDRLTVKTEAAVSQTYVNLKANPKKKKNLDSNPTNIKTEKREDRVTVKTEMAEAQISVRSKTNSKRKQKSDINKNCKRIKTEMKSEDNVSVKIEALGKRSNASKTNFGTSTSKENIPLNIGSGIQWVAAMLARETNIALSVAKNIVTLLENECTIPFIARYRAHMTGNMDADNLRRVKDCHQHIKNLEKKALTAIKQIKAAGKLTPKLEQMIYSVKSSDELDFIYEPYKKRNCKSKAEKARLLGLEQAAVDLLKGHEPVNVDNYINASKEGLKTRDEVIDNIQNIMADIFAKDEDMLTYLCEIEKSITITIKSSRVKPSEDTTSKEGKEEKKTCNEDAEKKFELYYNFSVNANSIQPHQILALNRGENLKILSVKFFISDWLENALYLFFERKWIGGCFGYDLREQMFKHSYRDSYSRLITPFIIRRTRSALNRKAQYAAIENFAANLKNLLQTPPVKGCSILGIDPGFRHGSKFALISRSGDVLWTEILSFGTGYVSSSDKKYMKLVREQLMQHKCELIAIGNGTGCRNIERIFGTFIKQGFFEPDLQVQYTIVNERGASVYSCSNVAKEEFPDLNPNIVSAVFIARTLQEPLSEFVKVEPKHLGVGMYQHDMPEKQLNNALDQVVEQCVSFVGVDLNTASIHVLKRVAGLGLVRAKNIIEWRQRNGLFKNRNQLLKVKNIGSKTFEQCSGFVRIYPGTDDMLEAKTEESSKLKRFLEDYNPLDRTCIHPESYSLAEEFLKKCELDIQELGVQVFIDKVKKIVNEKGISKIAAELEQTIESISLIAEALMQPLDYDYRNQFSKPVFRRGLDDISSISAGMEMTGVISNVTNFGAFVDIGVGKNGLIHTSGMNGQKVQIGDRVEVRILNVQPERGRIGLRLLRKS